MSEIAKCPFCGEEPEQVDHGRNSTCDFYECCGVLAEEEKWNKIAAAMELAKAEVVLDVSSTRLLEDSSIQDGTVELEDWRISHQQIMKRLMAAKDRVLEVFK